MKPTDMLQFAAYPTGRPLFVKAKEIGAIADAIEMKSASIAGVGPSISIVGTTLIVQGVSLQVQGEATEIEIMVRVGQGLTSEAEGATQIANWRAAQTQN